LRVKKHAQFRNGPGSCRAVQGPFELTWISLIEKGRTPSAPPFWIFLHSLKSAPRELTLFLHPLYSIKP
jgi:hypothetical protein